MKMSKSKNKKLRDQISKITKFQEVNVLRRYMRFIQDQHAMHFTKWRMRVYNLDLDKMEMIAFRLLVSINRTKQAADEEREHGEPIANLIPCLDPDVATKKMISDEELSQRFLINEDIFNDEIEFD